MFFLVPAHPGCPGQNPQSRKTVVCVCVGETKQVEKCAWQGAAPGGVGVVVHHVSTDEQMVDGDGGRVDDGVTNGRRRRRRLTAN